MYLSGQSETQRAEPRGPGQAAERDDEAERARQRGGADRYSSRVRRPAHPLGLESQQRGSITFGWLLWGPSEDRSLLSLRI